MSISKITALLNTLLNIKKLKRHTHTHTERANSQQYSDFLVHKITLSYSRL